MSRGAVNGTDITADESAAIVDLTVCVHNVVLSAGLKNSISVVVPVIA